MAYIFLAALGIVLLVLLLQQLETTETELLTKTLKWTVVGTMILAIIYLTLVGRLFHVAALIVLLIFLLKRDIGEWIQPKTSPPSLPHPMTEKEAAALLKVDLKASVNEIKEAFQKIKTKDSTEQDRLLQARDILLKEKKK